MQAARAAGFEATPAEIDEGVAEFAQRANTSAENFLARIGQEDVAAESFRDFVEAGVLWRKYVRERLGPRVSVDEGDVEAVLDRAGSEGGLRVLLSEIVLPARNAAETRQSESRLAELERINGIDAFAAAARAYSASATRERGGRLDWMPLGNLPPQLRDQLLGMSLGGVTQPLRAPNAIAIFQLRAIEETPPQPAAVETIDYAQFIAADPVEAQRVAERVDTCDDLYGVAQGLPADRLLRETVAPSGIPPEIRAELDRLDRNEISLRLSRGGRPAVTMLCDRRTEAAAALDTGELRNQIANRKLADLAENMLAALRADAVIVEVE